MLLRLKLGLTAAALSLGLATAPALAHGLVDVTLNNVSILNNNRVGIGVAANLVAQVCGIQAQVGIIASQIAQGTFPGCQAENNLGFVQVVD